MRLLASGARTKNPDIGRDNGNITKARGLAILRPDLDHFFAGVLAKCAYPREAPGAIQQAINSDKQSERQQALKVIWEQRPDCQFDLATLSPDELEKMWANFLIKAKQQKLAIKASSYDAADSKEKNLFAGFVNAALSRASSH